MCDENKKEKKAKIFSCCGTDGITEMMQDCFPDDAGFTVCLSRMNGSWGKVCGRKARKASPKDR